MKQILFTLLFAFTLSIAGNDPSIQGKERTSITQAMQKFVESGSMGKVFPHYDPVKGKLLELKFEKLHDGIVKKGDFFVSCADFSEGQDKYDLDFLVLSDESGYRVVQALVHAKNGEKRAYHLEK